METIIRNILCKYYSGNLLEKKISLHLNDKSKYVNLSRLITLYGVDEATKRFEITFNKHKLKGTLTGYIQKYGEELGKIKYEEKNSKLSVGIETLKRKGLSDLDILEVKTRHANRSLLNLENFILRHGEDKGRNLFEAWKLSSRSRSIWCTEYWENKGFSFDDSVSIISDKQKRDFAYFANIGWTKEEYDELVLKRTFAFTLAGYIQRYGEVEGPIRFKYDRAKGSSLEYLIEKHGVEDGTIKYTTLMNQKSNAVSKDSKIQKEFCVMLHESLPKEISDMFYGAPFTKSYFIMYKENEFNIKASVPDIRIKNILIEFDGDYWHSREETMLRDRNKEILNSRIGYITLRVAELDFKSNAADVVSKIRLQVLEKIDINFKHTFKADQ